MQQMVLNNSYQIIEKSAMAFIYQESQRRRYIKIWARVQANFYTEFGGVLHDKRLPLQVIPGREFFPRARLGQWHGSAPSPGLPSCSALTCEVWFRPGSRWNHRHLHYISKGNRRHRIFVKSDKGTTRQTGTKWIQNLAKIRSVKLAEYYQSVEVIFLKIRESMRGQLTSNSLFFFQQ